MNSVPLLLSLSLPRIFQEGRAVSPSKTADEVDNQRCQSQNDRSETPRLRSQFCFVRKRWWGENKSGERYYLLGTGFSRT